MRGWCVAGLAGSHRGVWYMPTTFLDKQAKWFPEGSLEPVPDVDADPVRHQPTRFGAGAT